MRALTAALLTALIAAPAMAPRLAEARSGQAQAPPPVVADTTATAIPGVIAAGTKVAVIKSGFMGTKGPIGLPDGSCLVHGTK